MNKTRRISSPIDLLALVPCVLGFHPEESLVLVVVAGEGSNLHARVDLPLDDEETEAAVATLTSAVLRARAAKAVLIAYTDDELRAFVVTDRLVEALELAGVEVAAAIRADGERWYSLDCDDDCCPDEGQPYDLSSHPFTAEAVLDGQVTYRDRQALADSLVGTDLDALEEVDEAAGAAFARLRSARRRPLGPEDPDGVRRHLVAEAEWVRTRVRRFLADREPLDHGEVGRLVAATTVIDVRDVAWAEMSRADAGGHVELWSDVVRRTPGELLAAPSALLGFAAWLAGDGALAWCALERCHEADPDYSMAGLIGQVLTEAIPPTTWRPIPAEDLTLFAG